MKQQTLFLYMKNFPQKEKHIHLNIPLKISSHYFIFIKNLKIKPKTRRRYTQFILIYT